MKTVALIININIAENENLEHVLRGYFKCASHASARKAEFVEILEKEEVEIKDITNLLDDGEDTKEELEKAVDMAETRIKAEELVNSKTNAQLKSFKAKYKLETENDKNETLKPAIVEYLVNNLDANFDKEDQE